MTKTFELSLRPYNGRLFIAPSRKAYEESHQKIFKTPDMLTCGHEGRFSGGCGQDDLWTYLLWANSAATMSHELSRVILHTFERCGIDPREAGGEPFCYMLSQLMVETAQKLKLK